MKYLLFILLLLSFESKSQCSIYGDRGLRKFQILDSLKNRNNIGKVDSSITLQNILTYKGDDRGLYNSNQYVSLKGYVTLVKWGGAETCNCHSDNKDDLDIHIEIALTPNTTGKNAMIVEINRYTRKVHPELNLVNIKKLIGKQVTVEGWLFYDEEHKQNAVTSNPTGTNLWRYTTLEVHPVMSIY